MLNLFLALGFSAVRGQFTLTGLATGFGIGYLALWISKPLYPGATYFVRVPRVLHLVGYFIYELIVSPTHEKVKILVCLILISMAVIFFVLYFQLYTSMELFIERKALT